jgi:hypothetical protein
MCKTEQNDEDIELDIQSATEIAFKVEKHGNMPFLKIVLADCKQGFGLEISLAEPYKLEALKNAIDEILEYYQMPYIF